MSTALPVGTPTDNPNPSVRSSFIPGTWRVFGPALIAWLVAAGAVTIPGTGAWLAGSASCAGLILMLYSTRRARIRRWAGAILLWCAVFLILGLRIVTGESIRADPLLSSAAQDGRSISFTAEIRGYPRSQVSEFGERYWVHAAASTPGGAVPMLFWLNERPENHWAPGLRVEVHGIPQRLSASDSVAFTVSVSEIRESRLQSWAVSLGGFAGEVRIGLRQIAALIPGAELVPGFAVGDTSLVTENLKQAMLHSSLTHVTAVSGANCALITGALVWVAARLGLGRRWRIIFAGGALASFVILVGPDASVQRAAVMAAVLLSSSFGGKRVVALPALGIAILLLLVSNPWQALDAGFALSVVATAGILLAATPFASWLQRRTHLPRVVALPIAVSAVAQFACGPVLLLLQPGLPMVGVPANVIAAPAVPLGTGMGLLAAATVTWSPSLAHLFVWMAQFPAAWVAGIAQIAACLPFARWHWPDGWWGFTLLLCCQGAFIAAWALKRGFFGLSRQTPRAPRQPWQFAKPEPRASRVWFTAFCALALGVGVGTAFVTPIATRLLTPRGWSVVACDVGQGDALLLRHEARPDSVMLVDTGDDAAALLSCLDRFGVDRIAMLVLSHDDRDHVGALPAIIDRVDAAVIAPASVGIVNAQRQIVRDFETHTIPFTVGMKGMRSENTFASHGMIWEVLAPYAGVVPPDTNAASLVMRVRLGPTTVLLLGDTGLTEQAALMRNAQDLEADIVKVAHHGSRDQHPALAREVQAQWALISAGRGNRYGHPADDTLALFETAKTRILRTDREGSIALIASTKGRLDVWLERPDDSGEP